MRHQLSKDLIASQGGQLSFLSLIFCVAWIGAHPYSGIWHDGQLYLGQALLRMQPEKFQLDLFFQYGSQDKYTIFSRYYVLLIKLFGVHPATLLAVILNQLAFIISLALCANALFGVARGSWALVSVSLMSSFYGGFHIISYAEPFFTARNVAEPVCLFGMWFLLIGRAYISLFFLLLACFFQPIVTLPCLSIWWVIQVQENRRFLWAIAFIPLVAVAVLMGIEPFDKLLHRYDPVWWGLVKERNPFVVLTEWSWSDGLQFLFDCVLVFTAASALSKKGRRFFIAALVTTLLFMAAAFFSSSILKNVLLTSMQFWRAHWILHLLAMMSIPVNVIVLWRLKGYARYSAVVLVLSCLNYPEAGSLAGFFLSLALYFFHRLELNTSNISRSLIWCFGCLYLLIVILQLIFGAQDIISGQRLVPPSIDERKAALFYFPLLIKSTVIFSFVLYYWFRQESLAILMLITFAFILLMHWDQRPAWQRYMNDLPENQHPFESHLSPGGDVYWHGSLLSSWLLLQHSSYFSSAQGAGLLFNRETAMEFSRRFESLELNKKECGNVSELIYGISCHPETSVVRKLCRQEAGLKALVFPYKLKDLPDYEWRFKALDDADSMSLHFYKCTEINVGQGQGQGQGEKQ